MPRNPIVLQPTGTRLSISTFGSFHKTKQKNCISGVNQWHSQGDHISSIFFNAVRASRTNATSTVPLVHARLYILDSVDYTQATEEDSARDIDPVLGYGIPMLLDCSDGQMMVKTQYIYRDGEARRSEPVQGASD